MRSGWIALFLLAGCSKPPELMPMAVGKVWTYTVRSGFDTFVEPVKVVRKIPVAGVDGFELGGPLGLSRLGWRKGVLFTDLATNCRFTPPAPILDSSLKERKWYGTMESMGKSQVGKGFLVEDKVKLTLGGHTIDTTLATLTITTTRTTLEIKTWFQPGVGIVQQEQRTGGKLDVALQLLGKPT